MNTPLQIPDHLSRADIGAYMRDLRLHYGLSEQDVSERLHIRVKYVTAIETAEFDVMPGKAYARGYVHSYAEFLGLDADQVVARCFGAEPVQKTALAALPKTSAIPKHAWYLHWSLWVIAAIAVGGYFALQHDDNAVQQEAAISAVESVPEDYLEGLRTMFMPSADSYDCLGDESLLGCQRSHRLVRQFVSPQAVPDMAPVRVDPPVEAKATPEAPDEEEEAE